MNVSKEIIFKTTRSGGKGGQNVNKVETAVLAMFHIEASTMFSANEKTLLQQKLASRINNEGFLWIKVSVYRTQLENKSEAIAKINELIKKAMQKKKARIATQKTKASVEKRIETKKIKSRIKENRKKYWND